MTGPSIAAALRIAADIAESDLNPEYAVPAAVDIASAVSAGDLRRLRAVAEQLEVYADAAGITIRRMTTHSAGRSKHGPEDWKGWANRPTDGLDE